MSRINYEENVTLKFQVLNGLFLGLPFTNLEQAGARLTIFTQDCKSGILRGISPLQIVENYLTSTTLSQEKQISLLFSFLQMIERQIVLCDALEDSAFDKIHNLSGNGTISRLLNKISEDDAPLGKIYQNKLLTNKSSDNLLKRLESYKTRIVLTAHPTQFYPQTVLGIINDLIDAIKKIDIKGIRDLFLQMGLTSFTNTIKPTPIDEAKSLIWYLEHIFYEKLTDIQQKLPRMDVNSHEVKKHTLINTNVEIGIWSGGDRDGNPFVNSTVTYQVADLLHRSILELYVKDLYKLKRRLTFRDTYDKLDEIIQAIQAEGTNKNINDFIFKLEEIAQTLTHSYDELFVQLVRNLIFKMYIFGFYFAKLDIRQNKQVHIDAITELFAYSGIHSDYKILNNEERQSILQDNFNNYKLIEFIDFISNDGIDNVHNLDNVHNFDGININEKDSKVGIAIIFEVITTIFTIHKIQRQNGKNAIERYIISNTESSINILELLFLINLVNLYLKNQSNLDDSQLITLEIVPLFETKTDLTNAEQIMESLYNNELYKKHLEKINLRQTIMLGFSDGTKDGGYLMANWSIYLAKKRLTLLSRKYNINIIFFDGRGGPPSRGGGNTRDFYHSMGSNVASQEIQLTVQGQTISSNFGTLDSAMYNFEQIFTSGLINNLFPDVANTISVEQEELIGLLATTCYKYYVELRDNKLFVPYLEEISTLKYLMESNVGSRPAKRNSDSSLVLSELRAIPYVGAWAQLRQNIVGFYGLGLALHELCSKDIKYVRLFKNLYQESLFFKTLINNANDSLNKSNFSITRYLKKDTKFGEFWQNLHDEFILTNQFLYVISSDEDINPSIEIDKLEVPHDLNEANNLREQIVLPLLIIQQYSMIKIRDTNTLDKTPYEKLVKKSLAANVNANRNSI